MEYLMCLLLGMIFGLVIALVVVGITDKAKRY